MLWRNGVRLFLEEGREGKGKERKGKISARSLSLRPLNSKKKRDRGVFHINASSELRNFAFAVAENLTKCVLKKELLLNIY